MSRDRNPDALSSIFFMTKRAEAAFEVIDDLVKEGWEVDYCKAQTMFGIPGTGKTATLANYRQHRPELRSVVVEVTPGCNARSFSSDILNAVNDPAPDSGSPAERMRRAPHWTGSLPSAGRSTRRPFRARSRGGKAAAASAYIWRTGTCRFARSCTLRP